MHNRADLWTRQYGLLLLATLLVGATEAQTQQRPQWTVGDTWVFHSTEGLPAKESEWSRKVVEALPGERYKVVTESNRNLTFDNEGNSIDDRGPDFSWRRFNLPLEVGKRWKHQRKIAGPTWSGTEESEWEVKAVEKITVPAGSYDCVRVDGSAWRSWTAPGGGAGYNRALSETTYWYCPAIKWAAKWQTRGQASIEAPMITTISELTSFVAKP
jgi:hypothetical protein